MRAFKQHLETLRERHLEDILARIEDAIVRDTPSGSSLVPMCRYHFSTGGKRLRAILPLLVADALQVDPARLIPFAAACEMIHNATLVHDDLQDGDRMRRDQDTIWVRYGEARAINLGDAMLYWAMLLVDELEHPAELRLNCMRRLARDIIRVIDGQEREFLLKDIKSPSIEQYFTMVEGKTSGLFALPAAGAAELCNAPADLIEAIERATTDLGVIFQIQDDILDLYGEKGRGESGSDLKEGKISALVVHFLQNAPPQESAWLREILLAPRDAVSAGDIERATALFAERGSLEFALDEIARRMQSATRCATLAAHPHIATLLTNMAELFIEPIDQVYSR